MTKEELKSLMDKYGKSQTDVANDLGLNRSQINKALSGDPLSGWANAALTQYFLNLELREKINSLYPIKKKP